MNTIESKPVSRKLLLALVPFFFGLGYLVHQEFSTSLDQKAVAARLQQIDPDLVVQGHADSPVAGLSILETNKGQLLISNSGDVLVRGSLEDLETGRPLVGGAQRTLPFLSVRLTPKVASSQPNESRQGAGALSGFAAPSSEMREGLAARLATLKAEKERKDAAAAAAATQGSNLARAATAEPAQAAALPPAGAIPKVGFDNQGKPVTEAQKKHQIKAMMGTLPEHWMMVYPAPNATSTITVLTDPTCPYCRKLHGAIEQLNAAGITVRYLFYPRYLGAGENDPRAKELVDRINGAWCSSNPKQAFDVLFNGGSAGRDCSELPEDDKRPRNPAVDHYTLGQVLGVSGTPHIIHDSGEVWVGYSNAQDLIGLVRQAQAAAR